MPKSCAAASSSAAAAGSSAAGSDSRLEGRAEAARRFGLLGRALERLERPSELVDRHVLARRRADPLEELAHAAARPLVIATIRSSARAAAPLSMVRAA